jgi:hypothetical protein
MVRIRGTSMLFLDWSNLWMNGLVFTGQICSHMQKMMHPKNWCRLHCCYCIAVGFTTPLKTSKTLNTSSQLIFLELVDMTWTVSNQFSIVNFFNTPPSPNRHMPGWVYGIARQSLKFYYMGYRLWNTSGLQHFLLFINFSWTASAVIHNK